MTKVLVVTYNEIRGFESGRHETDEAIMYVDYHGRSKYTRILNVAIDKADEDMQGFLEDLQSIDKVYVYVGFANMYEPGRCLIDDLKSLGKEVFMVACDCDWNKKKIFARKLGVELIEIGCGGYRLYDQVIEMAASS
ncbi:hypothetical protein ACFL08_04455 [Patescibacteria group bacterium]